MFKLMYTRRFRLNKRATIRSMCEHLFSMHKAITAWDVADAIECKTGAEVKIEASLCDLVLRKHYYKSRDTAYFYKTPCQATEVSSD